MTKKHFVFLLAIVVVAGVFFLVRSKSNEKHRIILKEVMELHQGAEPKIEKIIEVKTDLKKQIELLKAEAQTLREAAKKIKPATSKAVEKKEEAEKADQLSAKAAEIETLAQELEELEAELHTWKEDVASTLKSQKNKISKEVHDKLTIAKAKFAQLNDRFGKSIEKAGKSMQQPQTQEQAGEKK
jgi:Mg2+ and Co2+ transporter CorA